MENISKAEKIEDKDSEDEREGDYGLSYEKTRSHDDNHNRESISPLHSKQPRNKSSSRSCSPSSSATSESPKRSRSRSISKEQTQQEPLEKGSEKTKEQKVQGKLETSDKKHDKLLHSKSNRNYRDQRKRSKSREKTPKSSRSSTHKSHGGRKRSRSRSRERRSKSAEKRSKRSRSREKRSRSKGRSSRSRDRRSRSRDRRSRSRDRRSRSRESRSRDRRSKSRDRRDRRSRSRSRDKYRRSRSRDRDRRRHRYDRRRSHSRGRPRDFKEKALSNLRAALEKTVKLDGEGLTVDATSLEKPSNLPLNVTSASVMTPQIVLQQAMAAMSAKAQALTGISLPKYYNPAAVNPLKYAEQVQKRKLLWQANKEKPEQSAKAGSASLWENMTFAQDQDGKMTAKFRKLMGIKSDGSSEAQPEEEKSVPQSEDAVKKQEALFRDLDQQYEMARMSTHTHRGVGLGYTSHASSIYPPVPK